MDSDYVFIRLRSEWRRALAEPGQPRIRNRTFDRADLVLAPNFVVSVSHNPFHEDEDQELKFTVRLGPNGVAWFDRYTAGAAFSPNPFRRNAPVGEWAASAVARMLEDAGL